MKTAVGLFGALAVAIIAAYFGYYLNRNAADVRYTLSDKIPVSFLGSNEKLQENVQQLEVKNLGTAAAKRIQIKINGEITSHKVDKFSEADQVEIFNQNRTFELVYPELPGQAGFKLVFKATGDGIKYSDLGVGDSTGKAQEALSTQGAALSAGNLLSIGLMVFYFCFGALFARQMVISIRETSMQSEVVEKLLRMKRPWYVSDKKWLSMFERALDYQIRTSYISGRKIRTSECYLLLSVDKPAWLDDTVWTKVVTKAIESLDKGYCSAIDSAFPTSELLGLLREERPKQFPQIRWNELLDKASKEYLSQKTRSVFSPKDILHELREPRPEVINAKTWSDHADTLGKKYISALNDRLFLGIKDLSKTLGERKPDEIPDTYWNAHVDRTQP